MWSYISNKTPSNQNQKQNFQIFDLLQMSQKEKELKKIYLHSNYDLKKWTQEFKHSDKYLLNFLEGYVLKRRAQKNLSIYRIFRKNRVEAFSFYMNQLPIHGKSNYQSK